MKNKSPTVDGSTGSRSRESIDVPILTPQYVFCLYVAGLTPRSSLAIDRVRAICDHYLAGNYELTVIDLYLRPEEAQFAQIVVAPTLVKQLPVPVRLFVGDMSDERTILLGLNLTA